MSEFKKGDVFLYYSKMLGQSLIGVVREPLHGDRLHVWYQWADEGGSPIEDTNMTGEGLVKLGNVSELGIEL